ncbi:MAG: dolichyl-phosphate beta-glucosyltransferase [Dehalococcoidia bacterium]
MPRLDVVIPVYNEERALPAAIERLSAHLDGYKHDWRIVIADNASIDRTADVAARLAKAERVEYVRIPRKGRGGALKQVWLASDADILSYMDVDLSTDLHALPDLIGAIVVEGYDLATGSRNMRGSKLHRSLGRRALTWTYNHLLRAFLGVGFSDAQCGFKAISREAAQALLSDIEDNNWFFDTELLVIAEKAGYRVKDIPVTWIEDKDSRVNIPATIAEDLRGMWRLRRGKPWIQIAPPAHSPRAGADVSSAGLH